ncbi:hypothetical protein J6590_100345 [Homalodisca vitripennis]|nr:hypothetical protein J6590_100345 [Homalodisca vitripennis]
MVILAAAGLAGMYMVHLLAQDWTKIRPNRPAATRLLQQALQGISKRSIPDEIVDDSLNEIPTWDSALEQDPLGCARKLVCTLATRPRSSLRTEETNILAMVSMQSPEKLVLDAWCGVVPPCLKRNKEGVHI